MNGREQTQVSWRNRRLAAWARALAATILVLLLLVIGRLQPLGSPRAFQGRLAAGALSILLVAYPITAVGAALGLALFTANLIIHRRRPRSPWVARGLLLCGSLAIGIVAAETAGSAWLGFRHRMPSVPSRFPESRPGDPVEIVVIGGSSALGAPYEDWLSVARIVAHALKRAIPTRDFHVNMLAEKGASLEMTHQKLATLERKPDIMIIYSGHNEFLARFSLENQTIYYDDERPAARAWGMLEQAARISAVVRLARENLEKERVGLVPSRALGTVERTIGRPAASAAETQAVFADFAARLEAITSMCERIGCLPILVIPPGNDSADPNQSYAGPRTLHHDRKALFNRLFDAKRLEARAPEAIAAYEAILDDQPTLAVAHYRLARLLDRSGAVSAAIRHYILARDHDGLPLRCVSTLEESHRAVALRHGDQAILIDGPRLFRAAGTRGVIDQSLVHDLVHPTLKGQTILARAILDELKRRRAWGWPDDTPVDGLEPWRIEREFGIDGAVWATVCRRVAAQYEMIEFLTVDPLERNAWRDRFLAAAARLKEGAFPRDLGLPGVGVEEPTTPTGQSFPGGQ